MRVIGKILTLLNRFLIFFTKKDLLVIFDKK